MSVTPRRRILLVAYYYPPQKIIGARRPYALAKWLGRRGHDVTVLTSVTSGEGLDDGTGADRDDTGALVVRTRDLLATRLNWRRGSQDAVTGQSTEAWAPGPTAWGKIFVPDVQLISWAPFAVAAALRECRRRPFDAVITTSPVESAHAAGLALRRRGVPWIADLRDGWRFEAPREEWPLAAQRGLDTAFERATVRRADAVVMISEPLARDLRSRHGIAVETITNGFDPDDVAGTGAAEGDRAADATLDAGKLTLLHTGGLGTERTLAPLLEALARLAGAEPDLHRRVEIVLAGTRTEQERELYAQPEFAPFVRHIGFVPRDEAMALQRAADVLVLVTSGVRTGEATGKLFEYLAAQRPILVIGAGSAAADIVTQTGAGAAIPVRDVGAAQEALRRILAGDLRAPAPATIAPYSYERLAARYELVLERAIAAGAAAG